MIRVLIVDDHPRVRRGLQSLLSSCPEVNVVGEAADGVEALRAAADLSPDIVLMDIRLPGPDGIEMAYQMRHQGVEARLVILTAHDHDEYVMGALRAGAYAYLLKTASDETLIETIRGVYEGKRFLSPGLMDKVLREFQSMARACARSQTDLSEQELRVLDLVAQGTTIKEISEAMYLSERTVKRKLRDVKDKLGARNRAQAVAEAIKRGLI